MRSPIVMLLVVFAISQGLSSWERKLNRDGIVVDVRSVPGSDFKEFKARMRVKSTLERATEVMRDIPGYARWMKDCKEAREVQKISASSGIVYSLQATPWPIAEREAVVRYLTQCSFLWRQLMSSHENATSHRRQRNTSPRRC